MPDWYEATLESVAAFRKGISYKSEDYCAEGFGHPFITIKCFVKGGGYEPSGLKYFDGYFTEADRVFEGDILFAVTDLTRAGDIVGSPLQVPSFGNECFVLASMDCMKIIPIEELCSQDFLYHRMMLADIRRQMVAYSAGSTVLHLDTKKVPGIVINIPRQVNEQKYIASILDTVDRAIAHTEALIEKYQQIKAGLMHDLFTRGIGADGKLRPTREEAPELYQESAIGWIPIEWNCIRASDICFPVTKGTTPSTFEANNQTDSIPYIRVENLSFDGSLIFGEGSFFVSKKSHNSELLRSRVYPNDILMNIVGPPLGKVSVVPDTYKEWNTNQAIAIYRLLDRKNRNYLLYYLLSGFSQKWFYIRSKQTSGQVNLTLEMCNELEIPFPNREEEVLQIAHKLSCVFEIIQLENANLRKLNQKKKGLMHDLLTGEVSVKVDADEVDHV